MTPKWIQRRLHGLNRQWSASERHRRARIARKRCAQLLAQLDGDSNEKLSMWCGGAMSPLDVARIAG